MYEAIALIGGMALGWGLRDHPWRAFAVRAGVAALLLGTAVAAVSGELAESPLFAAWDALQVFVAAGATAAAARAWRRRAAD